MKGIFTIPLIFSFSFLVAQVSIKGKADNSYFGKKITAYTYDDYLSKHEKILSSGKINDSGKFELKFSTQKAIFVFLVSNNCRAEIYCEPDKNYEIGLMPHDEKSIETIGNEIPVELNFFNGDSLELNYLIAMYDEKQEKFINNNVDLIQNKSPQFQVKLDTFVNRVNRKILKKPLGKNFQNYVMYSLASLEEKCEFKNREELFNKYLLNKPVLYESMEYMNFVNAFFSPTIGALAEAGILSKQINDIENYQSYLFVFTQNKYLVKNDSLKELIALKSLRDAFADPSFKKGNIIGLLEDAEKESKIELTKKTAHNLIEELNRMREGTKIPDFTLRDKTGKKISPSDYKGRHVYLMFFTSQCKSCEEEMLLIPELKKKYGSKIDFVSISLDKDSADFIKFIEQHPKWDWTFLYAGNDRELKKKFVIKAAPSYYLINPQGNVQTSPAFKPGIDLEAVFSKILKPAPKNFKPGEK